MSLEAHVKLLEDRVEALEAHAHKPISMGTESSWWLGILSKANINTFPLEQFINTLYEDYVASVPNGQRVSTKNAWSRRLSKMVPHKYNGRLEQQLTYRFHSLVLCREEFEQYIGHAIDWDE